MAKQYVVLVTGASSGFGRITAMMLAQKGHIVYGTSRKEHANAPVGVRMLKMDVTVYDSVQQAINTIMIERDRLDVVVNNAGGGVSGAIELATTEEVDWQMNTNFMGVVNVCRCVLPIMRNKRSGKIINVSSIGGVIAVPYQGFYSASKFAVEGYSEALAMEVRQLGIHVCMVEPGDCRTNFTSNRKISIATLSHEAYRYDFSRAVTAFERAESGGSDPEKVGRKICKLIESKNPRFRSKVGPVGQVIFSMCKSWLPDCVVQSVVRQFYK